MADGSREIVPRGKRKGPHVERRLKSSQIKTLPPGRHTDGGGLYLEVSRSGARRWLLRIVIKGRRRDLGLGSASVVRLADARDRAEEFRRIARLGSDPTSLKYRIGDKTVSFKFAAEEVHRITVKNARRNGKHTDQWITTLRSYAFPWIGNLGVDSIIPADIVNVLSPIWLEKQETARRLAQRMNKIFEWAIVSGYRKDVSPVIGVRAALPKQEKEVQHFKAIRWQSAPRLMEELRKIDTIGAKALRFTIMTALRSGAVRKATWNQFSENFSIWTIPAGNMKARKEFIVPLPMAAVSLLREIWNDTAPPPTAYVFASPMNPRRPISENTMAKVLSNIQGDATVHGMRSVFKDWAEIFAEARQEVSNSALAHGPRDKVDSAYRREIYLHAREELLEVWSRWLDGEEGDYETIARRARGDAMEPW